jgi:hypothetical protein
MTVLYFISDVILACIFEPAMLAMKKSGFFTKVAEAYKKSLHKTVLKTGVRPTPLSLILISFGADPMTGRAAAAAAGHGFVSGWTLAITGDMFCFALVMVSTLWLSDVLGDGTWTVVLITVVMLGAPPLFRRLRKMLERPSTT